MLICRCFLLHKDVGNHVEVALLTPFVPVLFPSFALYLIVAFSCNQERVLSLRHHLFALCLSETAPWDLAHTALNALMTHINSLMNRAVLHLLDTPGFRAWIKQTAAQGAPECSTVKRNWCWFGNVGEGCNKARVLKQKGSVWSIFGRSVFSLVMQCEDTILIAHFGWVRIWPSCLWAAAELAPESVIIHFWSVIGIPFSLTHF